MEQLIDKGLIALCCLTAFLTLAIDAFTFGGFLVALAVSALGEVLPRYVRIALAVGYCAAALACPQLIAFLPLIAYDCMRDALWPVRLAWAVPLLAGLRAWSALPWAIVVLMCVVSAVLARRTTSLVVEREHFRVLRDDAREASMKLEARNRDLLEARDLSAQVATLAERGRIAREIHDNVGHLLTRAIMQVEALKVVHEQEPALAGEFDSVAVTLHEAMKTVRSSVHDLRDEATDPRSLMQAALDGCGVRESHLEYDAKALPADVARCFVSIVREASTNTSKHSDATRIDVHVRELSGLFQLVVQDNGTSGEAAAGAGSGMGLQTMDDRVRALGGTLRAGWQQDGGFRVFATVPRQ
ncbi:hypothetical protein AAY81_03120 [Denitrobacterium detoxificans]|uniref:histidine kinase n=1 Tax=Denitrobacterium detoxificans TaxID=79604 RepID=A0A172RXB5_9ACTN|nr:histidine kinase [Denitrobacterium detoxificans]ANE22295.1 hypothetical protein AAY81_03120 [Denitrobacterium detoxificans]SEO62325.1 Signal transduction histidine kinase [Denitrobacterium detoxificans]